LLNLNQQPIGRKTNRISWVAESIPQDKMFKYIFSLIDKSFVLIFLSHIIYVLPSRQF